MHICGLRPKSRATWDLRLVEEPLDIEKMGRPIKILLIEDSPEDQFLTNRMLEKARYIPFAISFADNLSTGIQYAVNGPIDIILLDLNLPDSSGVETYLKLKLQVPEIPVAYFGEIGHLFGMKTAGCPGKSATPINEWRWTKI
jgi:PleD family two-component response regulator